MTIVDSLQVKVSTAILGEVINVCFFYYCTVEFIDTFIDLMFNFGRNEPFLHLDSFVTVETIFIGCVRSTHKQGVKSERRLLRRRSLLCLGDFT